MSKNKNVPELRFKEFSDEWTKLRFGETVQFKITNSFSRENLNYEEGNVKNIHYGDIHTKFQTLFDITKENVPFVNSEISIKRITEDNYCQEGDIVFADASEDLNDVGKSIEIVNLNKEKLLAGLHTLLARPKDNYFASGFLGFLFKSNNIRVLIQRESQGSKVLSINVGRISNINISFPTIAEQTKIASFLTSVDDKLQTLKKKKALIEQYKKGVMQKIFSQELRFKNVNGSDFSEWEEKRIEEIVERIQSGKDKPNESNDYKIYGSMGVIGYNSTFSYEGTYIVIARVGANAGTVNIVSGKFGVSDNALVLECDSSCNVNFIYYLLKFLNLNKLVFGSGQPLITGGHLKAQIVQCPFLPEQTKIASFLTSIDEKINQTQFQIVKTESWKKGLLQKLFI